jgi:hypothetical protein
MVTGPASCAKAALAKTKIRKTANLFTGFLQRNVPCLYIPSKTLIIGSRMEQYSRASRNHTEETLKMSNGQSDSGGYLDRASNSSTEHAAVLNDCVAGSGSIECEPKKRQKGTSMRVVMQNF